MNSIFPHLFLLLLCAPWNLIHTTAQSPEDYFQDVPVYTSLKEALKNPLAVRRLSLVKQKLTKIPPELFELENLEELDLSRNQLCEVPPHIGQLEKLRVLKLYKNRIELLPDEIGRLHRLEYLDVSRNPLLRLPETLGQCRALRQILAWDTNLTTLPASLNELENLQEVDLRVILFSREDMQKLSEGFPKFKIHFSGECHCGPY